MASLTIRGIDERMVDALKREARSRNCSLNILALELLREALGMQQPPVRGEVLHDICLLSGTWTDEEAKAFREAIDQFETAPRGSEPGEAFDSALKKVRKLRRQGSE